MTYAELREAGIRQLEVLSANVWTDFNSHDPGITILEGLCYVLTELSYRTSLPMEDLLARNPAALATMLEKNFYLPQEILPCEPLTAQDYRALLVSRSEIRNAWVQPHAQREPSEFPVPLELYEVFIEFNNDKLNADFNLLADEQSPWGLGEMVVGGEDPAFEHAEKPFVVRGESIEFIFPGWGEVQGFDWFDELALLDDLSLASWTIEEITLAGENAIDPQAFTVQLTLILTDNLRITGLEIRGRDPDANQFSDIEDSIRRRLEAPAVQPILEDFLLRMKMAAGLIEGVWRLLNRHRNLCEDFIAIRSITTEEIGLTGSIVVDAEAEPEKVINRIYDVIDRFLEPSINYKLPSQLLEDGVPVDEVFDGPFHFDPRAFIKGIPDLSNNKTREDDLIFLSDINEVIMSLPSVQSVQGLSISHYKQGRKSAGENNESIRLSPSGPTRTRLSALPDRTRLTLYEDRGDELIELDRFPVQGWKRPLQPTVAFAIENNLTEPQGAYSDLSDYVSIQREFPAIYGLESGKASLEVRQLKSYLLPFEQILANYLSRLSNVKNQLAVNSPRHPAQSCQLPLDIPGWESVFSTDLGEAQSHIADYQQSMIAGVADIEQNSGQRNRILDHLLARHGESLLPEPDVDPAAFWHRKEKYLKNLSTAGRRRGQAFDRRLLTSDNVWESLNISGFERRICLLLGIASARRRKLIRPAVTHDDIIQGRDIALTIEAKNNGFGFRLVSGEGDGSDALLQAAEDYPTAKEAAFRLLDLIRLGQERANYNINATLDGNFAVTVTSPDFNQPMGIGSRLFPSALVAEEMIQQTVEFLASRYGSEGLHVVEHLLMARPYGTLGVFGTAKPDERNPVSFQVSIVFPNWPERFSRPEFQYHAETIIRRELPAHILPYIHWVPEGYMTPFEEAYEQWLKALALENEQPQELIAAREGLIQILFDIHDLDTEIPLGPPDEETEPVDPISF